MSPLKVAERQYNTEIRKDSLQALASLLTSDLILLRLVEDECLPEVKGHAIV